jgi:dolichol-phosphate mannosyltransferase
MQKWQFYKEKPKYLIFKMPKKTIIIIPTYNERENIALLIPKIFAVTKKISHHDISILVVDDTSPDKTYQKVELLRKKYPKLHLLINPEKAGLGGAYLKGMAKAFNQMKADYIFEFDADGSHDPQKLPDFFAKLDEGYDFVIGGRYKDGGSIDPDWPFIRKFYSIFGNLVIMFVLTDFRIRDWTSGYRAISEKVYRQVIPELSGGRFIGYTWQIGFLHKAVRKNFRITEIPIHFKDRKIGESKLGSEYIKNTLIYIFKARLEEIIKSKFVKFLIVGGIGFVLQFIVFNLLRQFVTEIIATPISTEIAIGSNFILNNLWTFKHQKISGAKILPQFLKFNLASFGSLILQFLSVTIGLFLTPNLQFWFIDAANFYLGIGIFLGLMWNYFAYNKFIWQKK